MLNAYEVVLESDYHPIMLPSQTILIDATSPSPDC